nr:hypothetical protein [Rhizophagus irregularis]
MGRRRVTTTWSPFSSGFTLVKLEGSELKGWAEGLGEEEILVIKALQSITEGPSSPLVPLEGVCAWVVVPAWAVLEGNERVAPNEVATPLTSPWIIGVQLTPKGIDVDCVVEELWIACTTSLRPAFRSELIELIELRSWTFVTVPARLRSNLASWRKDVFASTLAWEEDIGRAWGSGRLVTLVTQI